MKYTLECGKFSRGAFLYCDSPLSEAGSDFISMRQPVGAFYDIQGGVVQTCVISGHPVAMFPDKSLSEVIQAVAATFTKKHRHQLKKS